MFYYVSFDVMHLFLIFLHSFCNGVRGSPKVFCDKEYLPKGGNGTRNNMIEVRCSVCNQRLFDYVSGEFLIEIKCSRCKNINRLQGRRDKTQKNRHLIYIHKSDVQKGKQLHIAHL